MIAEVLEYITPNIKNDILNFINHNKDVENTIEEIRLRINKNIALKLEGKLITINHIVSQIELSEVFENICEKSVYSYTKQISEGFITIKGGNRVGLTGSCVLENGQVKNINYISSLNFRIAKQVKEVSMSILKYVIDIQNNTIYNTIIAGSPGTRKNNYFTRFSKKNFRWNSRNRFFA